MKAITCRVGNQGITLIELLVVVAVIAILISMIGIPTPSDYSRARRIECVNNLKQVGIGFRIWAGDNGGMPMKISMTNGGTREFVGTLETFRHFQIMSNELNTPKILYCPTELNSGRVRADRFVPERSMDDHILFQGNTNLSYFVGLDATNGANPAMFLSGDRNISNGTTIRNGWLELSTNQTARWTGELHRQVGNVLLIDGSVQAFSGSALQEASTHSQERLAMP